MGNVNYDFLQAGISHSFETGIRSRLNYNLGAGAFLNDRKLYFPDFKHFAGNEFFFQQGDVYTPASKNYTEIGYGLDGVIPQVLPFFRVEVISQWQNAEYKGLGFRIGTTLKFGR